MKREVYLVWGNHGSTAGIGEIAFTLVSCLTDHYVLRPTRAIQPGKLNIIIDEFSDPRFVTHLLKTKKEAPTTKYVIVASEFVTPISLLGFELGKTFNFFWSTDDCIRFAKDSLLGRRASYMHKRYAGFMTAIPSCDVLVFVHPAIGHELCHLTAALPNLVSPPIVVYPEFITQIAEQEHRLRMLPVGFNLTGTLTRYRRRTMTQLAKAFRRAGWTGPVWKYISFGDSKPVEFTGQSVRFRYDQGHNEDYLFNINPPQQRGWPFSSPMRILRAALLGHIPVVTKKFRDHPIEDISLLWDHRQETALKMQSYAADRRWLIEEYCGLVGKYNAIAREKNREFLSALARLERTSDLEQ
jgi:hypothetical protein